MARSRSALSVILALDAVILCAWCFASAFLPAPGSLRGSEASLATGAMAAAAAATQFPVGAEAIEKWSYKEPTGEVSGGQIAVLIGFFFIHAAGVADFYAKRTGGSPAVPFNAFRSQQFIDINTLGGNEQYKRGAGYFRVNRG